MTNIWGYFFNSYTNILLCVIADNSLWIEICNKVPVLMLNRVEMAEQGWVTSAPPWLFFLKMKPMHFGALSDWCADWYAFLLNEIWFYDTTFFLLVSVYLARVLLNPLIQCCKQLNEAYNFKKLRHTSSVSIFVYFFTSC